MKKTSLLLALSLLAGPAVAAKGAAQGKAKPAAAAEQRGVVVERIVAIVNDGVVLLSEVDSVLEDMLRAQPPPPGIDADRWRHERRKEILDTLIAEKLLEQEVKKLRIEVTPQEVDRVVQTTMQEHGLDEAKLRAALAQQGLTLEEYRDGLKKQLTKMKIVQLKVKSQVTVTDQDVKTIAKQAVAQRAGAFRVRASHILFLVPDGQSGEPERQKAEAAKKRIQAGEPFAKVAGEVSDDAASARRGGSLGEFGRGEMVPEFEAVAFAAEPGVVTGPVRSPFGWHLILVEERVQQKADAAAQEIEAVRQRLYEAEVEQAFVRYIDELRKQAYIETRL